MCMKEPSKYVSFLNISNWDPKLYYMKLVFLQLALASVKLIFFFCATVYLPLNWPIGIITIMIHVSLIMHDKQLISRRQDEKMCKWPWGRFPVISTFGKAAVCTVQTLAYKRPYRRRIMRLVGRRWGSTQQNSGRAKTKTHLRPVHADIIPNNKKNPWRT